MTATLLKRTHGRTTLWMTHDPAVIPHLDRVVALRNGRLVFAGTPGGYEQWLERDTLPAVAKAAGLPQET